jgi:uncharacterized membrane protein HdeD (DUF308 family)
MENEFVHLMVLIIGSLLAMGFIFSICYYANKKSDENPWYMLVPVAIMVSMYLTLRFVH